MYWFAVPVAVVATIYAVVALTPACPPSSPSSASLRAFDTEPCRGATLQHFSGLEPKD